MGGKKKAASDDDGPDQRSEAEKALVKELRSVVSYVNKLHKEHVRIIAKIEKATSDDFKQTGEIIETLVQQILLQQRVPNESRELVLTINKNFQALAERRDPATTNNLFTTCKLPPMPKGLMATYIGKDKSDDENGSDDSDEGDDESVAVAPAAKAPAAKAPAAKAPAAKAPVTTKPKAKVAAPKPTPTVAHDDLSSDEDEKITTIDQMKPGKARMDALLNAVAAKTSNANQPAVKAKRVIVESTKRKRKRQEDDALLPVELLQDAPGERIINKVGASSSRGGPSGGPVFGRGAMTFGM